MDYKSIYDRLCARARGRILECYTEKHRIVPGCLGGTYKRENVVHLTAEEHFLAHQLLVKLYPGNHKLAFALRFLTVSTKHVIRNNKEFGWIRRLANEARKGREVTDEFRQRMSDIATARWATGDKACIKRPKSAETKLKMAEAARRRWAATDEATKAEHRAASGRRLTQDQ